MSVDTSIEWCDATWNPIRGCSRVSEGCRHCYAEKVAARFSGKGLAYEGLAKRSASGEARWTGEVRLVEKHLTDPLRWREPRGIFVNSMSDLFHEKVPDEWIDRIFAVMALAPQHTFQVLTKRPERMRAYFANRRERILSAIPATETTQWHVWAACTALHVSGATQLVEPWSWGPGNSIDGPWPLPNVWLGVSVEDHASADARIPVLLDTPAAKRFVSAEPLLGSVTFAREHMGKSDWLTPRSTTHLRADVLGMLRNRSFRGMQDSSGNELSPARAELELKDLRNRGVKFIPVGPRCEGFSDDGGCPGHRVPTLDWVIVGGESGPGARPCDVAWIRSIVEQCRAARVPAFVKQLGAVPIDGAGRAPLSTISRSRRGTVDGAIADDGGDAQTWDRIPLANRKGNDPAEWPSDLRVREFPA